jgi:hypothetical protein
MLNNNYKIQANLRSSFSEEDLAAIEQWDNAEGTAGWYRFQAAAQIYAAEKIRRSNEKIDQSNKIHSWVMAGLTFALLVATGYQAWAASRTVNLQSFANNLNSILTENSKRELETAQKKLSFDIVNTLYKDFYQFADSNPEIIRKLKAGIKIDNPENLGLYLNGFEDLYEQCKKGLISRQDILMNFQYLIGPTCNNEQVASVIGNHGNGLKLLCHTFYQNSLLAKKAKTEKDSCK